MINIYFHIPGSSVAKNLPANAGDIRGVGSIPVSGRSPGGGNGNPLQYSCRENPMDRGTWCAVITWLSCTDHETDHALITSISCTDHMTAHALITWMIIH